MSAVPEIMVGVTLDGRARLAVRLDGLSLDLDLPRELLMRLSWPLYRAGEWPAGDLPCAKDGCELPAVEGAMYIAGQALQRLGGGGGGAADQLCVRLRAGHPHVQIDDGAPIEWSAVWGGADVAEADRADAAAADIALDLPVAAAGQDGAGQLAQGGHGGPSGAAVHGRVVLPVGAVHLDGDGDPAVPPSAEGEALAEAAGGDPGPARTAFGDDVDGVDREAQARAVGGDIAGHRDGSPVGVCNRAGESESPAEPNPDGGSTGPEGGA